MSQFKTAATRKVGWDLQREFARISGDRNPMHVDELAARRTQAGQPVVHGVHTLLWALESLCAQRAITDAPGRVRAKFLKWVYLDDESTLHVVPQAASPGFGASLVIGFQVEVPGMVVLTGDVTVGEVQFKGDDIVLSASPKMPLAAATDRTFEQLESLEGNSYTATAESVGLLFPRLTALLGGATVAEIAACSYVVGMEAPGLHSMFSKLDLTLRRGDGATAIRTGLHYRVSFTDERFRKLRIDVAGSGVSGTLEAFMRTPPVAQASMEAVAGQITPGEFAGMQALVIGGSRGLGELSAKLIAAGGGSVTLTYARGREEAESVAMEIERAGGKVDVLRYDVTQAPGPQLDGLRTPITHMLYFATNAIFRPKGELVSAPFLAEFVAFYLQGFYDLCTQLMQKNEAMAGSPAKLAVYYPSSVAVDERPSGMTEYAMAKAAGEQMCRDMNQYLALEILTTRLPRLRTDQTASVIPGREIDPISVMLPIVRELKTLPRG